MPTAVLRIMPKMTSDIRCPSQGEICVASASMGMDRPPSVSMRQTMAAAISSISRPSSSPPATPPHSATRRELAWPPMITRKGMPATTL